MQDFFEHLKVVHDFFFPLVFSLHITKSEHFMRYAYTSMEQKMIHVTQALLSLYRLIQAAFSL